MIILNFCPEDPIRDINKCPAIILAINRIVNITRRIIRLIVSITVINGIKIKGVRWEHISIKQLKIL